MDGEASNGTIVSLLVSVLALVGSWIGWARGASKDQQATHAGHTRTLREVIASMQSQQDQQATELKAVRAQQVIQAKEIATLEEKVRNLERQRDQLLTENTALKAENVALMGMNANQSIEIARQSGEIRKLNDEISELTMLMEHKAAVEKHLNKGQ